MICSGVPSSSVLISQIYADGILYALEKYLKQPSLVTIKRFSSGIFAIRCLASLSNASSFSTYAAKFFSYVSLFFGSFAINCFAMFFA